MADLELNLLHHTLVWLQDSKARELVKTKVHQQAVWERTKYKLKHIYLAARSTAYLFESSAVQSLTKQVSFVLPTKYGKSHDWAAHFVKCKACLGNLICPVLLASRPCPFHVLKQTYVANPVLFLITECSSSVKLASPTAVLHSADVPGVGWNVSSDRAVWLSEASLLSAQQQLHTPEEQSSASGSRAGCSSSYKHVQVSHRVLVSRQAVFFPRLLPQFWLSRWIDSDWDEKVNFCTQQSFDTSI